MAFLRLFLLATILISCVEDSPRPESRSHLFSGTDEFGKTWQIEEIEIELGTLVPHSCLTDNFITYYPNGTYEINEGASKCNPSDPPGVMGKWYLNRLENRLFVEIGDSIQSWEIEETKEASHRISSNFIEGYRTYSLHLSR
ncbi:hypothetical protein [Ekhidna sp.]|uniref:hypothetical protein n=1 Tax=Ekhidna sp. TaxID=2608089 RepID=UPI0032994D6C